MFHRYGGKQMSCNKFIKEKEKKVGEVYVTEWGRFMCTSTSFTWNSGECAKQGLL